MRKKTENKSVYESEIVRLITCLLIAVIAGAVIFIAVTAVSMFEGGKMSSDPADSGSPENTAADAAEKEKSESGVPDKKSSEQEAESGKKAEKIHTLTADRLKAIERDFSSEVYGFGLGLDPVTDENNRPVQVNSLLERFAGSDVKPVCYCADAGTPAVAFTFQAGMENGYTKEVLDILDRYRIKSTFYINYSFARKSSDMVKRMIDTGHEIGNHSYNCPDEGIASEKLADQMADAINLQDYVLEQYGYEMSKYNFNSGIWSEAAVALMSEMGYEVCFCSSNYSDYFPDEEYSEEKVLNDLKKLLHNGCVYCFHMTNPITAEILPGLIEFCEEQGYTIVQLD